MISEEQFIHIIKQVCGKEHVEMDSTLDALDMDSTNMVELLIEVELLLDRDILDANVNLYEWTKVADIYGYLAQLPN